MAADKSYGSPTGPGCCWSLMAKPLSVTCYMQHNTIIEKQMIIVVDGKRLGCLLIIKHFIAVDINSDSNEVYSPSY